MFHFALGKLGAAIKAGTGSAGVVPLFSRDYEATGSLGADATFARASTATVIDFEGLVKTTKSGEVRFEGLRRVENRVPNSNNLENSVWLFNGRINVEIVADVDHSVITSTGTNWNIVKWVGGAAAPPLGSTSINSIEIKLIAGSDTGLEFYYPNGSSFLSLSGKLTSEWQRFSVAGTENSSLGCQFSIRGPSSGVTIHVRNAQSERSTGQTNQNPSEYVSVGVLSAPYHGANVDGVKYFATENGNTVTDNVVTEGTGAAITGGALLMEPAATNLWTHSESLESGNVSKIRSAISANTTTAPDGNTTADTLSEDATASNTHYMRQQLMDAASTYIVSIFAKAKERSFIAVGTNAANSGFMTSFNLSTGAVNAAGASLDESGIEDYGDGWFRCWVKATAQTYADFAVCNDSGQISYTGDGSSGVYVWGASCVLAGALSSYIPTSGSAVTRAADALSYSGIAADNETRAVVDGTGIGTGEELFGYEASVDHWAAIRCSVEKIDNYLKITNDGTGYGTMAADLNLINGNGLDLRFAGRKAARAIVANDTRSVQYSPNISGSLPTRNLVDCQGDTSPVIEIKTDNNTAGAVFYLDYPILVKEVLHAGSASVNSDTNDWNGVVDANIVGGDNSGYIKSITVYAPGERPA